MKDPPNGETVDSEVCSCMRTYEACLAAGRATGRSSMSCNMGLAYRASDSIQTSDIQIWSAVRISYQGYGTQNRKYEESLNTGMWQSVDCYCR